MKRLVTLILVLVSLFSMAACGGKDISKGISIEPNDVSEAGSYVAEEAIYKREYLQKLQEDPRLLVAFLTVMHVLPVNAKDVTPDVIAMVSEGGELRKWALEAAELLVAEMHVDCNWEELRKIAPKSNDFATYEEYKVYMEQNHPTLPLAANADTGEPISSEPADPWAGPTD